MLGPGYEFHIANGHCIKRRAIGFLEEIALEGRSQELDARQKFDSLKGKAERDVRSRFDHWIDGGPPNDRWFHGWPNDHEVGHCFCFKWHERGQNRRFYGFLYHSKPKTDKPFQICVLAYYDTKNDDATDRAMLMRSMRLRDNALVRLAIEKVFSDKPTGKKESIQ